MAHATTTVHSGASLLAPHATFRARVAAHEPRFLTALRDAGRAEFEAHGLPSTHEEAWKYTNVTGLASTPYELPQDAEPAQRVPSPLDAFLLPDSPGARLVFVDGTYAPALSRTAPLPARPRLAPLADVVRDSPSILEDHLGRLATSKDNPFNGLNLAYADHGACLLLPDGAATADPFHIVHLSTEASRPTMLHPRNVLVLGRDAQARVIETYAGVGDRPRFTNAVTEIALGEGAVLHHAKFQHEPDGATHLHTVAVQQARASNYHHVSFTFGAALARNDVTQRFDGEGAECTLDGLYVLGGRQHADNHTSIDHAQPHCTSREFYKGILDDKSHGVFYGKIVVRKGAQKTNANQQNKNLLLSDGALADSTPALEILADDVKCSHGSSIGQLDPDVLFYLRSRGLPEDTARSLLTYGFAREILERVPHVDLRAVIDDILLARLPQGRTVQEALR